MFNRHGGGLPRLLTYPMDPISIGAVVRSTHYTRNNEMAVIVGKGSFGSCWRLRFGDGHFQEYHTSNFQVITASPLEKSVLLYIQRELYT